MRCPSAPHALSTRRTEHILIHLQSGRRAKEKRPGSPNLGGPPSRSIPSGTCQLLEQKLQSKLNATRAAPAQNWIAQADVRSRRYRIEAATPADRNGGAARCGCAVANAVRCGVRKKGRQQRASKRRVIEYIVKVRPELHFQTLVDRGHLADRKVQVPVVGSEKRIASLVAEVACSRRAIRVGACRPPACMEPRTKSG